MEQIEQKPKTIQKALVSGWDFTLKRDEDLKQQDKLLITLKSLSSKYVFQLEKSDTGYVHFQGRLRLIKKNRLTALKKLFKGFDSIHLTPTVTKNYKNQDFSYVMKADTRLEGTNIICDTDPEPEYIPIQYRITEWRPWQKTLLDLMNHNLETNEFRKIYCLVDQKGNCGKTTFSMRLCCTGKAQYIPPINDSKDIMRMCYDLPTSTMYIIDMTRSMNKDKLFGIYSAIEQLKNGMLYDDRYNFRRKFIDSPQVCIMTNEAPDTSLLSSDRWVLKTVEDNQLIDYIEPDISDFDD